jgi:transcription elongation factor GreA
MDKRKLLETLIAVQKEKIKELMERIGALSNDLDLDDNDTVDPEDLSHQSEAGEMLHLFRQQLLKSKADLTYLESLDSAEYASIQPGSIVTTQEFHFFIGHTFPPMNWKEGRLMGISTDSPFYAVLKTKQKGESFLFNNHEYSILSIQ